MARDDDHLPLWTPLSMLALSIAAGAVFTLSMQREPAARPTAAPRSTPGASATWPRPCSRSSACPSPR